METQATATAVCDERATELLGQWHMVWMDRLDMRVVDEDGTFDTIVTLKDGRDVRVHPAWVGDAAEGHVRVTLTLHHLTRGVEVTRTVDLAKGAWHPELTVALFAFLAEEVTVRTTREADAQHRIREIQLAK
jgi:hypothetical protein